MPNEPSSLMPGAEAGHTTSSPDPATGASRQPAFCVVRGHPTAEELAAVISVLGARAVAASALATGPTPASANRCGWSDARPLMRRPVLPRQGGWRASGLPGGELG